MANGQPFFQANVYCSIIPKEAKEEIKNTKEYQEIAGNYEKAVEKYNELLTKQENYTKTFNNDQIHIYQLTLSIFCILTVLFYLYVSKMEIIVTNKRVYGKKAFGKRVDLPIDTISAVGTSFLKGIDIGTSAGKIKFKGIRNNIEIHTEISKLLNNRQNKEQKQVHNTGTTEELKQYKELLDNGVITQAEFEAKKKQLLGI